MIILIFNKKIKINYVQPVWDIPINIPPSVYPTVIDINIDKNELKMMLDKSERKKKIPILCEPCDLPWY